MMKMLSVTGYNKSGSIEFPNIQLPIKRIVCPRCNGEGKHVNPSIDGHGLTAEDLQDDDFRESYFSGVYDVRCEECKGNNVIDEIDHDTCKTRLSWFKGLMRYYNKLQLDADARRESDYERRLGA